MSHNYYATIKSNIYSLWLPVHKQMTEIKLSNYEYELNTTSEPRHDKTNKVSVRPAKTQISLGIRPVWPESSLCVQWVAKDPSFLHADSEDSDQTGRMPRLIWVFAGRTATLFVLSCRGSNKWTDAKYKTIHVRIAILMLVSTVCQTIECIIRTRHLVFTFDWLADCMFRNRSFLTSEHVFTNFINGFWVVTAH